MMDYFSARAGAEGSRLLSGPSFPFEVYGGLGLIPGTASEIREYLEALRAEIEEAGFTISSGSEWMVVGLPAVGGSNAEIQAQNTANQQRQAAWNSEISAARQSLSTLMTGAASVTPLDELWGSDSKPVPQGATINYGDLIQQYQQAQAASNWPLVDSLAKQLNAITAAGPLMGGAVPFTPLVDTRAGIVYSAEEAREIAHADIVRQGIESGIGFITLADLEAYPYLRKWLPADLIERGLAQAPSGLQSPASEPPPTGGFFPGDVTATAPSCAPGYMWDDIAKKCVPMETPSMFSKPNGAAAPVVSSTALDTVDVTKTGATINVKGQPKNLVFGTDSFAPTPPGAEPAIDEGAIPAPMTAGFGGGMLGMLALGGLALAILAAPKRKR